MPLPFVFNVFNLDGLFFPFGKFLLRPDMEECTIS